MAGVSKLGIIGDPYNVGWAGPGIHEAAAAFRRAGLIDELKQAVDEVADFGDVQVDLPPRDDRNAKLLNPEQVKAVSKALAEKVEAVVGQGFVPLIVGGEDSVMLGIVEGFRRALGERLGLILMDAHGDFNTPQTSPSGLIGGMEIGILAGRGPHELVNLFGRSPLLREENIVLYGTRDLDAEEVTALAESEVRLCRAERIRQLGPGRAIEEILADLTSRCDNLYLHVDLDILDESHMAAQVLPVPHGLTAGEFVESVRGIVASGKLRGLAVMVFNAAKDATGAEARKVVKLIADSLGG